MRRSWIEEERLTFPLVLLPLEMTERGGDSPFWKNRLMWAGFLVAGLLESFNFLNFLLGRTSYPRPCLGGDEKADRLRSTGIDVLLVRNYRWRCRFTYNQLCPFLIAWVTKRVTLKYDGIKAYRTALPFFLGLILGDYVIPALWGLFGLATNSQQYMAFPH